MRLLTCNIHHGHTKSLVLAENCSQALLVFCRVHRLELAEIEHHEPTLVGITAQRTRILVTPQKAHQ